ncbi:MAG: glycosyltransferase [Myxococcaceae bacterium]|jgi:glycosyltransferase involved in cell wall biosynthesis|nr:glycosyltransferase [Myxococcaceae bacterium]
MGAAAIGFQRALRHLGVGGEVFADEVAPGFDGLVRPVRRLRVERDDLVLYHHGIASALVARVLHLRCHRGVVFHNITPARFYEGTRLASALTAGRAQLSALAPHVELSIGVSRFNALELEASGHRNVHVVPLLVEPERFAASEADARLRQRLEALGAPRLLTVSRVVPHKRVDDLVSLHAEVRRRAPRAQLLVAGGYDAGSAAFRALARRARAVGNVTFLGRVDHAGLVAAYRAATLFVSMSEHEGLGVPLLEAFASDLPVLAFGAAAVPETMGGHGLCFDEKHFAALAEVVQQVHEDDELRERLVVGQRARLPAFSLPAVASALAAAVGAGGALGPKRRRQRPARPRVAFVVQRFGEDIVGGAEAHARQVALRLAPAAGVEVFTTCAVDHLSWKNELPAGTSHDGPLTVHRFAASRVRHIRPFNRLSGELFGRGQDLVSEARWLADQGPACPALLERLAAERERFDAVAFFTYLYQPTAYGVPLLAERALVVPTAHDEPPLRFQLFADVFERPRELLCNTPEEEALVRKRFPGAAPSRVVGVGVEALPGREARFRAAFGVAGPYLLYVGRMEAGKGVDELLAFHQRLVSAFHDAPSLVLVGSGELKPRGARVVATGRVDEQTKWDALHGAMAVVVPSRYESLSLLALEAFAAGAPLIGNTRGDVVRGQLERSRAGVGYDDERSFIEAVRAVGVERQALAERARRYAERHTWRAVIDAWLGAIGRVSAGGRSR